MTYPTSKRYGFLNKIWSAPLLNPGGPDNTISTVANPERVSDVLPLAQAISLLPASVSEGNAFIVSSFFVTFLVSGFFTIKGRVETNVNLIGTGTEGVLMQIVNRTTGFVLSAGTSRGTFSLAPDPDDTNNVSVEWAGQVSKDDKIDIRLGSATIGENIDITLITLEAIER